MWGQRATGQSLRACPVGAGGRLSGGLRGEQTSPEVVARKSYRCGTPCQGPDLTRWGAWTSGHRLRAAGAGPESCTWYSICPQVHLWLRVLGPAGQGGAECGPWTQRKLGQDSHCSPASQDCRVGGPHQQGHGRRARLVSRSVHGKLAESEHTQTMAWAGGLAGRQGPGGAWKSVQKAPKRPGSQLTSARHCHPSTHTAGRHVRWAWAGLPLTKVT